jgi:uncharacterized protein
MLRTSSYIIFVDLPNHSGLENDVLLVHGYTGAYDRVSKQVAGFLRTRRAAAPAKPLYGEWSGEPAAAPGRSDFSPSEATIATLRDQGYMTELSPLEEEEFFARFAVKLHERALRQAPSYIFMPTYDCNLRCSYCYQDHMRSDCSFSHLLRSMKRPMVDRIFAALPGLEERHGLGSAPRRRNIGFFGGEPLLAAHRPLIEYVMGKAFESGEADFWAVTNGTEIDAYRELLGPGGIARLQITLDGPPAEHDRRRIHADGSGSYEQIAANITLALERGAEVSVRMNVDQGNIDHLPALADEIVARGWNLVPGFSAYTSPVRGGESPLSSWDLDRRLTAMRDEHPNLDVIARPDEGMRGRARHIFADGGVLPKLRPSFCGAHDRMYIFDPFGDIYACWERTGDEKVRIGRVTPEAEIELHQEPLAQWRGRTVASNPVCRRCRFALHCGGGCAVLALDKNGKFNSNYCDGFGSRFRASVAEAYLDHVSGNGPAAVAERVCDL